MSSFLARSTASRAVHLRFAPRLTSLGESREILRLLSQFGEVEFFKNSAYHNPDPSLSSALIIFREAEAARECLRRSPLRFRMQRNTPGANSSSEAKLFDIRAADTMRNFRHAADQRPFYGHFNLQTQVLGQADLARRVPLPGLSCLDWRQDGQYWRMMMLERGGREDRKRLGVLWAESQGGPEIKQDDLGSTKGITELSQNENAAGTRRSDNASSASRWGRGRREALDDADHVPRVKVE